MAIKISGTTVIDDSRIVSNTQISSTNLLSGRDFTNTIDNGDLVLGDIGWTKESNWTINLDSTNAYTGNYVAVKDGGATGSSFRSQTLSAVVPGETVYAECYYKTSVDYVSTVNRIRINWLDKDAASISFTNGSSVNTANTDYSILTVTGTAPANSVSYVIDYQVTRSAGTVYAGGFYASKIKSILGATAVASTSGTSIDFTGIPSWVKRITVMFRGVSTSGTSNIIVQIGDSGGIETTGYISSAIDRADNPGDATAGFLVSLTAAADTLSGIVTLCHMGGNVWVASGALKGATDDVFTSAGDKALSDVLDRVRITTVGGSNTFDAGSINILYE
jgi:hypothetical protein